MSRPPVAVIVPTRDRCDFLALTLRSILNQSNVDLRVIVVDDGDGLETASLVQAIGDSRVTYLRSEGSRGVSNARNRGVEAATQEWVAFCDDDDIWAPDKLGAQITAATVGHAGWVYAGDVAVSTDLRVLSGSRPPSPAEVMRDLPHYNAVPAGASNVLVRAEVLARAGLFDPGLRTSEDWDLWLRIARAAGSPACVPRPLVALRVHPGMASRRAGTTLEDIEVIARRHGVPVDWARHRRWLAWMALEDGRRREAIGHYVAAVALGDWRSAARAVVALFGPAPRPRHSPDDSDWAREAQRWLDRLRESATSAPGTSSPILSANRTEDVANLKYV